MSKTKSNTAKGNWKHVDGGMALVIPLTLIHHPNWKRLTPHALKLVIDLCRQYSGNNNGYLCPAWEAMQRDGWKSRETLFLATTELMHYGIIQKTRQGGRNRPSLYALTWWPINGRDGDALDVEKTLNPSNAWKEEKPGFERPEWITNRRNRSKELHDRRAA